MKLFGISGEIESAVKEILQQPVEFHLKLDRSPVSNLDLAIQKALIGIIHERYPDDNIVCEEEGQPELRRQAEFSWIIDPIDGTANFLAGQPEFGVSIGLMSNGIFLESLLIFPSLDENYYAARGQGIWLNGAAFYSGAALVPDQPEDKAQDRTVVLCSKSYDRLRPLFEA